MLTSVCCFGDHPADPDDPETYVEITAWVSGPKKDGGVLRTQTGRRACKKCISAMRAGFPPGEDDLFTITPVHPAPDTSDPRYRVGWKHGYLDVGPDPDLVRCSEYLVGRAAGEAVRHHLDGFFFFVEGTP